MRKCLYVYKVYHEYFPTSHPPSWLFPSLLETSLPWKSELMVQPDIAGFIYAKLSDTSDIRLKLIKFVHGIFANKNILKPFLFAYIWIIKNPFSHLTSLWSRALPFSQLSSPVQFCCRKNIKNPNWRCHRPFIANYWKPHIQIFVTHLRRARERKTGIREVAAMMVNYNPEIITRQDVVEQKFKFCQSADKHHLPRPTDLLLAENSFAHPCCLPGAHKTT